MTRRHFLGAGLALAAGAAIPGALAIAAPSGPGDQVGAHWSAYTSVWLPRSLLEPGNRAKLVDAWFTATRQWSVGFHFIKGLAGAPPEAIAASRDTATNPQVPDAFALAIIAESSGPAFRGMPLPDAKALAGARERVHAAMTALKAAAAGLALSSLGDFAYRLRAEALFAACARPTPHGPRRLNGKR